MIATYNITYTWLNLGSLQEVGRTQEGHSFKLFKSPMQLDKTFIPNESLMTEMYYFSV